MSVQDFIKKSILQSDNYATQSPLRIVIVLLLALLIGAFIYKVYQHFFTGVIYSRSFAMTLVGMTLLTSMVTLAISSNIVISLGMVGALSIVRYRTAVKDPMDLLYLFWAITSGITVGAGMYVLAVVTSIVILLMLIVFSRLQETGKVYIAVVHYDGEHTGDKVIQELGRIKHFIKSETMRKDSVEMAIEVFVKNNDLTFVENIKREKKSWSSRKKKLWLVICLIIVTSGLYAIFVYLNTRNTGTKFEYTLSDKSFGNPLMGYVPSAEEKTVSEDVHLVYVDITWKELEPKKGHYNWETIEESNQFKRLKKEGKQVVLRFLLDYPGKSSHKDIPDWLGNEISDLGDAYNTS